MTKQMSDSEIVRAFAARDLDDQTREQAIHDLQKEARRRVFQMVCEDYDDLQLGRVGDLSGAEVWSAECCNL